MMSRFRTIFIGKDRERGFTLIELIVVMAILAILALIAVPKFTGVTKKAKQDAHDSNVQLIADAAELYYDSHNQSMPESIEVLINQGYLKANPVQPISGEGNYTITLDASDKTKIIVAPGKCDESGEPSDEEVFEF